jgi:hypothetical protein
VHRANPARLPAFNYVSRNTRINRGFNGAVVGAVDKHCNWSGYRPRHREQFFQLIAARVGKVDQHHVGRQFLYSRNQPVAFDYYGNVG